MGRARRALVLLAAGFVGGVASAGRTRKHRRQGPPTTITEALSRAEKKLRQAEHFLGSFPTAPGESEEVADFSLSACVTAARSVYQILLDQDELVFQRDQQKWRKTRSADDRQFFNHMRDLRDEDIHRGYVLVTVPALYIQYAGSRLEASKACRRFIDLQRDLVAYVRKRRGE
jgi:hypothetical protein